MNEMTASPARSEPAVHAAATALLERFGASAPAPWTGTRPWLRELQARAAARFAETGLPSPREEAWKYTSLRPLETVRFRAPDATRIGIDRLPTLLPHGAGVHRLVFVNGRFRPDLSAREELPEGLTAGSLATWLEGAGDADGFVAAHLGRIAAEADTEQPLLALNTAAMSDGLVLRVAAGCTVELPIEILFIGAAPDAPLAFHPRTLIVLEAGSRATVVEHHVGLGTGTYLANGASEIAVGTGASLAHYKVQAESSAAFHLSTSHATVARDGRYDSFVLSRGARLARNEAVVRLGEDGAEAHLNGVYMIRDRQHCDITTRIDHLAPHTSSREVFKGAIDDRARGVFQGCIVVHPHAQKSDGHQLSKTLLLSDGAEIDAKPELEIYADDVKCSHGATVGDIDPQALFY
ncbi:MAG: Fe-S cluster assembly protein SufD, partial [Alphaproteobacteria bacterium]